MTRHLILWLLFILSLSVSGQEQSVHFISKLTKFSRYYISLPGADTTKTDFNFQPRTRGDTLVRPIMKEIKTLLDSTCPGRNDSLTFNIFVVYDRTGNIIDIAYMIGKDDINCFNEEVYVGIYNAFVNISRTLPVADLINAYWSSPLLPKERKTGNSRLMLKYNSKTPSHYW